MPKPFRAKVGDTWLEFLPMPTQGMFVAALDSVIYHCPMFNDGSPDRQNIGEIEVYETPEMEQAVKERLGIG